MKPIRHGHWNAAREERILPEHMDDGLEIVYVRHGSVTWICEGEPLTVRAGEVSFTWPWQAHAAANPKLPPVDIYWVLLPLNINQRSASNQLTGVEVEVPLPRKSGTTLLRELGRVPDQILKPQASFQSKFIQLVEQLEANMGKPDLSVLGWLYLVLAEIQEAVRLADVRSEHDEIRKRVEQFFGEVLPRCLEETWTLERMSDACGLGRTTFAEQVKQLKGDTPIRVLTRIRIEAAKEKLRESTDPITRIGLECGFSSSQRFATVFKAYTGQSPRDFRRMC